MEKNITKKRGIAAIFRLCPGRHILLFISAAVVLLHLLTRHNHALMSSLSENAVQPIHRFLSVLCSGVNYSIAEVLIGFAAAAVTVYLLLQIFLLIKKGERGKRTYRTLITLASAGLSVYALFCILWGVYYYGDDFSKKSGIEDEKISVEQLTRVTEYFACLANEYADKVQRDGKGFYTADREEILEKSPEVFKAAEKLYPCLEGPDIRAKGIHFSRLMSYTDFTGFFFPFTAEANVNTDFPVTQFAATVAHELSHQRGVAKEQEANFTAVLACLNYGDADYCYSAALLAYTYLGNALAGDAYDEWERIYYTLDENILRDFARDRAYWKQFETPVKEVSNKVYDGFLKSYDQNLGLKSYGACVDMLVNYYDAQASEYLDAAAKMGK